MPILAMRDVIVRRRALHDGCVDGRFRKRTWLRKRLPWFLVERGVAAKGRGDCRNHEWYKASDAEDAAITAPSECVARANSRPSRSQ